MRTPAMWFALLLVIAAVAPASALAVDGQASTQTPAPADTAIDVGDTTAPTDGAVDALSEPGVLFQTADGDPVASTTVVISLRADRSAFWRVETHYTLETANETRAFRTIASRYETGNADVGPNAVLFEALKRQASESTGREMAIRNVTYHSSVDEAADRGTLALTFRWTNFLRRGENGTLVLDDVFAIPTAEEDRQRTWLSIFDADQRILIRPPDGYTVTSTSIPVQQRNKAVILTQPSDFQGESGALRITYSPVEATDRLPIDLLAGVGIAALAAVVASTWLFRRRDRSETSHPGDTPPTGPGEAGGAPESTGGTAVETGGEGSGESEGEAAEQADSVDLSLLSDEEQVEHLLEQNGGRMKQATIVDEMGWSDAKVSQLLSGMAEEGRIDKLRLGRENLISLPDEGSDVIDGADDDTSDDSGETGDADGT